MLISTKLSYHPERVVYFFCHPERATSLSKGERMIYVILRFAQDDRKVFSRDSSTQASQVSSRR
jgi:hypothetical protein